MKQYCRYCVYANLVEDDLVYCQPKNKIRNKQNCVTLNRCKQFELNELDVFDIEKTYKPREPYKHKPVQLVEIVQLMLTGKD